MPRSKNSGMQSFNSDLMKMNDVYHQTHSKMMVVRSDIHLPAGITPEQGNEIICQVEKLAKQEMIRKGFDPDYAWKREQKSSPVPHWHLMHFCNAQVTQSQYAIHHILEKHLARVLQRDNVDGLVDYCNGTKEHPQENGLIVKRNDPIPEGVYNQMGYLTKEDDLGEFRDGIRDYGMSNYKKRLKD